MFLATALASAATLGVITHGKRSATEAEAAVQDAPERRRDDRLSLPQKGASGGVLKTVRVERATLAGDIQVVGSVAPAEDHFAVVGPSVSGRLVRLHAGIGDRCVVVRLDRETDQLLDRLPAHNSRLNAAGAIR